MYWCVSVYAHDHAWVLFFSTCPKGTLTRALKTSTKHVASCTQTHIKPFTCAHKWQLHIFWSMHLHTLTPPPHTHTLTHTYTHTQTVTHTQTHTHTHAHIHTHAHTKAFTYASNASSLVKTIMHTHVETMYILTNMLSKQQQSLLSFHQKQNYVFIRIQQQTVTPTA